MFSLDAQTGSGYSCRVVFWFELCKAGVDTGASAPEPGAIAMQNELYGVMYMILFGLGTIPMMSSVVYLNSFLSISIRNKIQKIIPFLVIIIGILFIFRGLGLGIPYVSPSDISLFVQPTPNCH